MARHNLGTVVSFEVTRTLTKRGFWIATLIVPVIIGIVIGLVALSNSATDSSLDSQKNEKFSFSYSDESGYVDPAVVASFGGTKAASRQEAIAAVKAGVLDAYFDYGSDPTKQPTEVYGVDRGIFNNGKYASAATRLLVASAEARVGDPKLAALLQGNLPIDLTAIGPDGNIASGIGSVIPPLIFLVIFYIVFLLLGNQMLNSPLEEKENRVAEMILTTLNPTTLIVGKVISLFIIGVVQALVFAAPIIIGYLFFRTALNIPNFDLPVLVFEPGQMAVGALLLIGGFALFTGTLFAAGAIMPTVKDASLIFGILMVLIFVQLYAATLIVSNPQAFIVQVFTYFPYSAPVTAMLRNGFGSLHPIESTIVIVELFALSAIVLRLAVRLFRFGSIEYTKRVSLGRLLPPKQGN